jgi:hypothetical protein
LRVRLVIFFVRRRIPRNNCKDEKLTVERMGSTVSADSFEHQKLFKSLKSAYIRTGSDVVDPFRFRA